MYFKLAKKNLLSHKSRTILTLLGISIGIASLVLLLALSEGLKQALFQNITSGSPLTQITVQPVGEKGGFLKLLDRNATQSTITPEVIAQIRKLPDVTSVSPELSYSNISSLMVNIWGQGLQTDTMFFGLPYEYIASDLQGSFDENSWNNPAEPYPVLISRKIIDLYNFTVAPANNLPTFSEKDLIGKDITLLPGQSTFFPQLGSAGTAIKAKIAGFSDRTSLIGVTMPIEAIRELNKLRDPNYKETYLRLFVTADSAEHVEAVSKELQSLNLQTFSTLQEISSVEENMRIVTLGLTLISVIILLVAGLMIANTFLAAVGERKHEIGLLRALGATRADIRKIFLAEAALLGFTAGLIGILAAVGGGTILNQAILQSLPNLTSKPDHLFVYQPLSLLGSLLFSAAISCLFAYIPASKASKLDPLKALTED